MQNHYSVLIIGGGAAGITVAVQLRKHAKQLSVGLIEPSEIHYYQPAWTLVGGGEYEFEKTGRSEASLIPKGVEWIKDYAETMEPENNAVVTRSGSRVTYDYLVVCPGLQLDFHKIEGLPETLGKNGVASNYSPTSVRYTWECIQSFQGGNALFTQPVMPIKCAGAPQKIMYLAADRFRRRGISKQSHVEFCTAGPAIFGIPFFARALDQVAAGYGIVTSFNHNLVAIDGPAKLATFEHTKADGSKERVAKNFDFIHVTPPQSAPDFIKRSPLANAAGWVDLHENTLQHVRYANVFGLGDAGSTPNAKTAAAVRKQAPIVVKNLLAVMAKQPLDPKYDGYGSCPLTTSLNTMMLAEFAYGGKVTPSLPWLDPRARRYVWWLVKKYGLPWMYWDYMLKGWELDLPHKADYAERFVSSST